MIDPTGGAGGKLIEMAAKGGVVLLLSGTLIGGAMYWLNGIKESGKREMALEIKAIQAESDKILAEKTQVIDKFYSEKHIELINTVNQEFREIQARVKLPPTVTTEKITERASTEEGRDELNRDAEKATIRIMNQLEEGSNWNGVYKDDNVGSLNR